jgi:hypothetical protein
VRHCWFGATPSETMPKASHIRRPIISAPVGPVKSSRGPDLVRGDSFEVVAGINECATNASTPSDSVASRRSRRISAGFLNTQPPSASPTVVGSDVSAVTRVETHNSSRGSLGKRATLLSMSSKSLLRNTSQYTLVAHAEPPGGTEDVLHAGGPKDGITSSIPRSMSKLPKSRTMMVLHELKKSFSRQSVAKVRTIDLDHKQPSYDPSAFEKRKGSNPSMSTLESSQATLVSLPRKSSYPSPPLSQSIKHVGTAQSSEYWSGRFVALQDRFSSENFSKFSLSTSSSNVGHPGHNRATLSGRQSLTTTRNRLTYLAPSNTTSALTTATCKPRPQPSDDEDDLKCKRIFNHLESLCTTTEAKMSLRSWQQAYACCHKRPKLLPEGGLMYDRGQQSRLAADLGNRFTSDERRRRSAFQNLADSNSRVMGATPGRGVAVY